MTATDTHKAIDAVWRIESARIIAGLTRIVRDVGLAEELAQDALVAALQQWPESGIPDNPGAWLMAAAKNRAIDMFRRNKLLQTKHEELGRDLQTRQEMAVPDFDAALDDDIGDDLLRLIFISCHPVLSTEGRVALTLRLARTMRWATVGSGTRNARAISSVVKPPSKRSVSATRASVERTGWQEINMRRKRSSPMSSSSAASKSGTAISCLVCSSRPSSSCLL